MPYPDDMQSVLGGPYYETSENEEKSNEDQTKLEAFCDELRELADSVPSLIDRLHFGEQMIKLRNVQAELNAMAEDIEREDISGVLWEVCE